MTPNRRPGVPGVRSVTVAYVVRTPENVTFEFELAGVGARAVAWLIDALVMGAIIVGAMQLLQPLVPLAGGFAEALGLIVASVVQLAYFNVLEWAWGGRTVGKRVMGLRVVSERGLRIDLAQAILRNLVRFVDFLPGLYLVGGASTLFDRHRRRLGDLAAGTIVVRERRAPVPSAVVPPSERHNTFVDDPSVALAVRRITAPEREAMIRLSLRREQLPLSVRRELFRELAEHLERRLGVERPSFFSEEKYVLNLTAVALGQAS